MPRAPRTIRWVLEAQPVHSLADRCVFDLDAPVLPSDGQTAGFRPPSSLMTVN
jgi:hypothetical protein